MRLEQSERASRENNIELVFESMNELFPALEQNGTQIRDNLTWEFKDQTSETIAKNTTTTK